MLNIHPNPALGYVLVKVPFCPEKNDAVVIMPVQETPKKKMFHIDPEKVIRAPFCPSLRNKPAKRSDSKCFFTFSEEHMRETAAKEIKYYDCVAVKGPVRGTIHQGNTLRARDLKVEVPNDEVKEEAHDAICNGF